MSSKTTEISTENAVCKYADSGEVELEYNTEVDIPESPEAGRKNAEAILKAVANGGEVLLQKIPDFPIMFDARQCYFKAYNHMKAVALVVDGLVSQVSAQLLLNHYSGDAKLRIFKGQKQAREWLSKMRK